MAGNNEILSKVGYNWWDETEGIFATVRFFINPVRFDYFSRILQHEKDSGRELSTVLDVGCGDGSLAKLIRDRRPDVQVRGIDVLVRAWRAAPGSRWWPTSTAIAIRVSPRCCA